MIILIYKNDDIIFFTNEKIKYKNFIITNDYKYYEYKKCKYYYIKHNYYSILINTSYYNYSNHLDETNFIKIIYDKLIKIINRFNLFT